MSTPEKKIASGQKPKIFRENVGKGNAMEDEFELDIGQLEAESDESPYMAKFKSFFENSYLKDIEKLANQWPHHKSLEIDFKDLEHFDFETADELLEHPDVLLEAAEMAVQSINIPAFDVKDFKPHVRFYNLPKDRVPYLRNIGSEHLGKLTTVEGLVRQVTDVLPKLKIAAWQCRRCANVYKKEQETDKITQPMMCECKHREFVLLPEQSVFMDSQKILVQEPLELLKGSEQATNFEVIVTDDLVNKILPGDRTKITGIVRLKTPKEKGLIFQRFMDALHLEETAKEFDEVESSPEEIEAVRQLAKTPKIYDILIQSIAPNIYGHNDLKEAIALQLFGGITKLLPNESKVRGNIHVLLVGDPGCLVGDERVALGNGAIERIEKLGTEHLQEISTQVLTGEGQAKRDWATAFHYYANQPVMEIITESGKSIKGTLNHPLLCVSKENGKPKRDWKRLDEFQIGDKVAVVTHIPCTIKRYIPTDFTQRPKTLGPKFKGKLPAKVTPELAGLFGYIVGDGWVTQYKTGFVVNDQEKDLLPKLLNASQRLFGIKPIPHIRTLLERKMPLYYSEINSKDIAQNLKFLAEKRVPELVMRSGNKVAAEFLKWLFEADGCCFCKGRGRRAIALKAKNIELLRDVQMLLLRFSIHSRITSNALQIRRGKDIQKYVQHIGFASAKKRAKLKQLAKEAKSFARFNSQRSEKIVKIIHHPVEDVFDIEVPAGHRFIANGVISHNTAKSQLLQSVHKIAPKAVYVTGKTSTGAGLCIAPDSLILNDNGFKSVQEFVESNFNETSAKEEIPNAWSNDFLGVAHSLSNTLDFVEAPVEKIWRIKPPEKMFKITTRTGRSLSLTPATSLIRIKNGKIEWISASELQTGDYVATPRNLPEGNVKKIPTIQILASTPNIKTGDPLAVWIKEITDRLIPKYGSLQAIAKKIGKSRNTLYAVRNPKFFHGWELKTVIALATEAGYTESEISEKITTLFISHGKNFRIPRHIDNPDLAYLAGLALGDGNFIEDPKRGMIRIACADPELLNEATRIIQTQFGIEPERFDDGERVPGIRVNYKAIAELLKAFGLHPKKTQNQISHLATEMSNPILARLLQGLFDTDGYVATHKNGSPSVGISSVSPLLAQTLQLALLKFGIISRKRVRKIAGKTSVGKTIHVTSRNDAHVIEITDRHNLALFSQQIGFALSRKQEALEKVIAGISCSNTNIDVIPEIHNQLKELNLDWEYTHQKRRISTARLQQLTQNLPNDHFLKKLGCANIFWDQIKTKEPFKPEYQYVYDFSVKEHHNFIANGFFVHNTATAVKDDFGEGGWTLKAGALVLANGGMAMIDEFDKMDPEDRSAMHEAMEQGMISVAKAGIVTRLKTETTILAAANPKFSRFDQFKNFFEQIDLPPTLISRFDLFFMIRDVLDRKRDEEISAHILKIHQTGAIMRQHKVSRDHLKAEDLADQKAITPIIDNNMLKKYIAFARQQVFPVLTKEAIKSISEYYVNLREQGKKEGTYSATHRQLEGLVRLSEASARIRLSDTVEEIDAARAIRLLRTSLQELVTDKETGRIDIDLLTTGQSTNQTQQLKTILNIVKSLSQEHDKVLVDQVLEEAGQAGIDKEKGRDLISKLKRSGELYEPSHGVLKPVQRE